MCTSLWYNGHLTDLSGQRELIFPIFIRSLGLGFIFVPLSVIALSDLPPRQRGNAAGLFNLTRELGGSIGTAWMSTALDRHAKAYVSVLSEHVNIYDSTSLDQLNAARGVLNGRVPDSMAGALRVLSQRVGMQGLVRAFNEGFVTLAGIFALALLLVMLLRRPAPGVTAGGAH